MSNPNIKVDRSYYRSVLRDSNHAHYGLMFEIMITPENRRTVGALYEMEIEDELEFYTLINIDSAIALDASSVIEIENYSWFIDLTDVQWSENVPSILPGSTEEDEHGVSTPVTWSQWASNQGMDELSHDGKKLIGRILGDLTLAKGLDDLGTFTLLGKKEADAIYNAQ